MIFLVFKSSDLKLTSKYKNIVTYASFDFNHVLAITPKGKVNTNAKFITVINKVLAYVIKSNPETLFIGKKHPGDAHHFPLEMVGLLDFENFRVVGDEYSIFDLAKQSKIWLSYRSSTNLEAWLMGLTTISICDDSVKFSAYLCKTYLFHYILLIAIYKKMLF